MNTGYRAFIFLGLALVAGGFILSSTPTSIFAEEVSFGVVEERVKVTVPPSIDSVTIPIKNSIYFFGDIMLARDVERRMSQVDSAYPFLYTEIPTESAYAVANFESAVPVVHVPTPNNTFRFSTKKESLPALANAGFTHVSLANNHAFDAGLPGYNHTITQLWENDIVPFGHPTVISSSSVVFLELDGIIVALIAVHTLFTEPDRAAVSAVLSYAAEKSDKQIIYLHWGEEYLRQQSDAQRQYATFLIGAGADMIVGHHPHVVQGVELILGVPVFYSLGNYIFDQYFSPEVQTGLVLNLSYNTSLEVALLPVTSAESRIQPRPMSESDRADFLETLATLSAPELAPQILTGKLIF